MKASTTARGYDGTHKATRALIRPFVERGMSRCTRCKGRIMPGQAWDLDHSDDRSAYLGAAHRSCNRRAGALKRNAVRVF